MFTASATTRLVDRPSRTLAVAILSFTTVLASAAGLAADPVPAVLPAAAAGTVEFAKDIQPILAGSCFSCHGPEKQKGDLRLDSAETLRRGGESGQVIVAGKSAESLLIQLVAGLQPDKKMPAKGDPLTAEQIGLLRAWIDQGARWPESGPESEKGGSKHWAFKAPVQPTIPAIKNAKWPRNDIDRFVVARLEKEGLAPSPEADRPTLIRRLSLDLVGLPPTPAEVDAFVADRSADACSRLVERLLASPHYGERWGRHWLDAARYADTNGYEKDLPRPVWPYRDWVIEAFNRDLPFDEFAVEQLAGDLLPNATLSQKVATGFLRNSMLNEEGGVDPEQFRIEGIIDRMDAMGRAFLGLTINCAQCHNHKFDPISQRDYYRLFAFLNSDDEPEIEVPTPEQAAKRADLLKQIHTLEENHRVEDPDSVKREAAWEETVKATPTPWVVLPPESWFAAVGVKFEKFSDGSLLAKADRYIKGTYDVTLKTSLTNITGFRIELLTHTNLPYSGPGRSKDGLAVLTEFSVEAETAETPGTNTPVELANATADFEQPDFPVSHAIDGVLDKGGWGIDAGPARRNTARQAVFQTKKPLGHAPGTILHFTLRQNQGDILTIGRFRLSATTADDPKADPLPPAARSAVAKPREQRTPEEQELLWRCFCQADPQFAEGRKKMDELYKQWPAAATTLALAQRAEPRTTRVFKRGDWLKPTDEVSAGVPGVLHPLPDGAPPNRLTLARWLVDRKNPLLARVIVNRAWQAYFGQGIVTTPEDFGTRVDAPSHPELLDWLACRFMEDGWSMKQLHRLIVSSATYRQASRFSPQLALHDPYNKWLGRGPRFRVEAEVVRDIALSASGLLSPKIGGPSVYPPIPDGVLSLGYGAAMPWPTSTGADRYRRGLYTFWKRSVPYPSLLSFDAPNADAACVRRVRSDTPLQALTTLNDTLFVEAAQALALRVWKEGGRDNRERAIYAFRLCVGRRPDSSELHSVLSLLGQYWDYFDNRTATALQVAVPDVKNLPGEVNLHKVAAWTMVARVLLNLDETITKD